MQQNREFNLNSSNIIDNNLDAKQCMSLRNNPVNSFRENGYNPFSKYHVGDLIGYNGSLFMSPTGDCVNGVTGLSLGTPKGSWIGNFPSNTDSIVSQTFTNNGVFNVPLSVKTVYVSGCGGGGGSLFSSITVYGGGGGAGGAINLPMSNVTGSFTVTVGKGANGANGGIGYNNGGNSSGSAGGGGGSSAINNGKLLVIFGGGGGGGGLGFGITNGGNGGGPSFGGNGGTAGGDTANGGNGGGVAVSYDNGASYNTIISQSSGNGVNAGNLYSGGAGGFGKLSGSIGSFSNGGSVPYLFVGSIGDNNPSSEVAGGGGASCFGNGGDLSNLAGIGAGSGPSYPGNNKGGNGQIRIWYYKQ